MDLSPTPTRPGLIRPVRQDPLGVTGPTRCQASGRRWRRTSQGFYVPAAVDSRLPEQRIVEASVVIPDGYGVTGWGALRWWSGCRWFDGFDARGEPVPVSVSTATHGVRSQPGIDISEERVWRDDVAALDGLALLSSRSAVSFEARRASGVRAAVIWLDMAAYCDLISVAEMQEYAQRQSGWTGIERLRRAIALTDENSWSPQETRMRLAWMIDAELPTPLANRPIFDRRGRHLITPDLVDPATGVIAEYDGAAHHGGSHRLDEVEREGVLADHGLVRVTMVAGDRPGPRGFVERLRRAQARAADSQVDPGDRSWTLQPPPGWTTTTTVADRRALSPGQRARFLRYRAG